MFAGGDDSLVDRQVADRGRVDAARRGDVTGLLEHVAPWMQILGERSDRIAMMYGIIMTRVPDHGGKATEARHRSWLTKVIVKIRAIRR